MGRRRRLPAFDELRQQGVAARGGVHLAPLRQDGRPAVGDDREEAQHLLPVDRVFLRREGGQSSRVDAGDLYLVQQAGKCLRQPRGLIHGPRPGQRGAAGCLAEPLDQAREQQAAFQRRDRVGQRLVGLIANAGFVLVDVAEGADARQQQRAPRRRAQEGEAERPAGAARRQQGS